MMPMPMPNPLAPPAEQPPPGAVHPVLAQHQSGHCAPALLARCGLALAMTLAAGSSHAQAQTGAATTPPAAGETTDKTPDRSDTDRMLTKTRQSVRLAAEGLARGVDSWFGDRPFEDGGRVSEGRLSVSLLSREDEPLETRVRFHARWRLPNLGERSYFYLGQGDRRELVKDQPDALSRSQQLLPVRNVNRGFFAGLGTTLRDVFELRLGFRGGLKPYVQASYQRDWDLSPASRIDFRETLFWTFDDRLGSTTALSYEQVISPTWTARWLNAATVTQRNRDFEWSSNLGAYKVFGDQRLLSLEALFNGVQGSGVGLSDYGLQAKWEQPVHRDWLIGEVIVGHFWPRKDASSPRERAWALGAGLKLKF